MALFRFSPSSIDFRFHENWLFSKVQISAAANLDYSRLAIHKIEGDISSNGRGSPGINHSDIEYFTSVSIHAIEVDSRCNRAIQSQERV